MSRRRTDLVNIRLSDAPNAHAELWLDKYLEDQTGTGSRSKFIAEVSGIPTPKAYIAFYQRWEQMLKEQRAQTSEAHVKGRMIIGLGDESVLETSISLHRTYGVPYIPGSALKGLAASYADQRLSEEWRPGSDAFKIVFGDIDNAGYITFFDALYIPGTGYEGQVLYPDIITVHHQKYYQGTDIVPADWDSPIPVPFLSATGSYLIALAGPELEKQEAWIEKTFAILKYALAEMGIGAKTSSGYGRMELEPKLDPTSPDIQAALRLKEQINEMPDLDVPRRIESYFRQWRDLPLEDARRIAAKAIIRKVRNAGAEGAVAAQQWYRILLTWLTEK